MPAAEINNILFIMDSSGSMKAKAGGKTKMDAAKEVVIELIGELSAGVQAGLMAYGHRQKNDCNDVELLIPIGRIDKDGFAQKVQSLQPLGETPISFSIRQAADVLKRTTGKKTVILISDGEETCKEDPCVVAAELKKADIDLQVHVVGFGIDKPVARRQLNCIAGATGGTYKDAADAAELKKTLEGMAKTDESTTGKGRLITVGLDSNGEESDWKVSVYPQGTDSTSIAYALHSTSAMEIPAGKYDVKYERACSLEVWKRGVEIKAGQDTRIGLEQLGRVRPTVHDANGNDVSGKGYIEVHANDLTLCLNMSTTGVTELAPGTYDFRFWSSQLIYGWRREVVIKAGLETPVEITVAK